MLLIKNGYFMNPATDMEGKLDVLIQDENIIKIEKNIEAPADCEVIDASGCIVAPGFIDVHVHFRDPGFTYKEDILTGAKAALAGGFTRVVLMANTKPAVDSVETLAYVLEKGKGTGLHVESCSTITKGLRGREIVDMEAMAQAGAAGFTDDGIPIMDEKLLKEACVQAAFLCKPISLHEENPQMIAENGIHAGKAAAYFQLHGSPREAEITMVERDLKIALETGVDMNIQHVSTKEAVELIRKYKKKPSGEHIYAEATPHHFSLTEEDVIQYGTLAKMNPPLREEADRQAIIKGLQDGTIDLIATDHAPHSEEEKGKPFKEAPSGIIGLETALPLGITYLVETGELSMMELLRKVTCNPAKLYHLKAGSLAVGEKGDVVIFHPKETRKIDAFMSKSCNSPFVGRTLTGVVKYTITDGKIVYQK